MLLQSLTVLLTVIVATTSAQSYGELRLVQNGATSRSFTSGRLEIFINGQWGTVCDDSFSITDANVACQQLGYSGASSIPTTASSRFDSGSSSQQIWLDNVACQNSSLQHILACRHNGIGIQNCGHQEDVAVFCSSTSISDSPSFLQVRLVDGSYPSQGRVEVYCGAQWGTMCEVEGNVGEDEAGAICRQLGYTHASSYNTLTNLRTAPPQQPIWLGSGYSCPSSAPNISSCTDTPDCGRSDEQDTSRGRCLHSNDIVVQCNYSGSYGDLRLVQGTSVDSSHMSGRLEIFIDGQWGTICDDDWGQPESIVACRQLGYSGASDFGDAARSGFGVGTGQIWLDDVICGSSASEPNILGCSNNGLGVHNCGHSEDISITCTDTGASNSASVVGIAVGCAFGALCLIITGLLCIGFGCSRSSSKHRRRPVATATLGTNSIVVPGTAYPAPGVSPYPTQPPPQPGAYPVQPTAYPEQGKEPPPPYPGQSFEMHPTAPPPQAAYPPAGYPPSGYPQQQISPYPTQAPGPAYPAATYPTDPSQPAPYPSQPAAYPIQTAPYPSQPAAYPSQTAPYPSQPATYPGQPATFPSQPAAHPSQTSPYPADQNQ